MNIVKGIDIKNRASYFFGDIIHIKSFDRNKIKIDQKSYKNILTYYIIHETTFSVNHLYLIIKKKINELKKVVKINI